VIDNHRKMLKDRLRNQAFYDALKQVIHPGETRVADIGAGTGFLAFLARQLGAKACFLYEHGEILDVARRIAKRNGIQHCEFIHRHSAEVKKPTKVDVVVSETLGNFALEENLIENMEDAKRILKPGGRLIPAWLEQFIAPVTTARFFEDIAAWDEIGFGLDFTAAREISFHNIYVRTIETADLLRQEGAALRWDLIDFREANSSLRQTSLSWKLAQPASIYGFALWWECTLIADIILSTSPGAPPTHWEQIYMPIPEPLHVKAGEHCDCWLEVDTRREIGVNLRWRVTHRDITGKALKQFSLDMRKGYLE
jgi:protein arginine N-methyltransferase 1